MATFTAHQRTERTRLPRFLRDWARDHRRCHVVRHQQQARLKQLERLLATLDDRALDDVVGVPRDALETALRLPPERALERVTTLMRDAGSQEG
ncbi:hypothetical protein [Marinobacter sp. NFXS9]|uniref:hypothetical protein n=1 Tax=Marinobacter sp. NFXS9 TaxID=2818433 RepID=UPI0032DFEAD7